MQFGYRDIRWVDFEKVIAIGSAGGKNIAEIEKFRARKFTETGERKPAVLTGYPEEIWVAENDGNIMGYLHFFTDCWDGYEDVTLSLATDPALPAADAEKVREFLEEALRTREP